MTTAEFDSFFRQNPYKHITLTFSDNTVLTNENIISESLTLEETLCSEENLTYGACESSCFSIRIAYTNKSFKGLYVQVGITVEGITYALATDDDNYIADDSSNYLIAPGTATLNFGNYLVVSDTPTNDRQYRDLVCYDKMYEIADVDVASWYSGLTFPMTLKNFRDSLFTQLGVTQETTTLVNDSYSVLGGFSTDELSCRDVLVSICELNGVFGHIDKATGKFKYISLPSADTITYPYYVNGSGAYEDYVTDKVTGILAKSAEDEVGTLVGTATNTFTIIGNLCLYGDEGNATETTALTNLLNQIKDFQYRPFTVQTYGNPMLPLGTNVVFDTTYQTVESLVVKKYLTGIQAMKDNLTATGEKSYPADTASLKSSIKRMKGTTHKLVNDVNTLWSEIYDASTGIKSEIQQLSDKVILKVDSNGKIVQVALSADPSTGTEFKVSADNIEFIANDVINLTANQLGISSTNFSVDKTTGNVTVKGAITTTSLDIDSLAALSVAERQMSFTTYYWNVSAINSMTDLETQKQLQIDTANRGLYINGIVDVGERLKVGGALNVTGQSNLTGVVYAYGGIYTKDVTVDNIDRSAYWNINEGNTKSLNSALKLISDNVADQANQYIWYGFTRSNITQNPGDDYWTIQGKTFPAKTGYTRFVIITDVTNRSVYASYSTINASNQVEVYTHNVSSSAQTFSITGIMIYLRDDLTF